MLAEGIGKATGKIILMGEHSVVYGEPAIAFPFSGTQVVATVKKSSVPSLCSTYHDGTLADAPPGLTNIQQLTAKLQQHLHTPNFHLTIQSTIPSERGMGSSAAVAVAVTRAFFDWQEEKLSQTTLLKYVNFSESIAHGNPSGIDAAATSGCNPIYFERGKEFLPFPLNIDAYLLVADTGIKGQTRAAVRSVAKLFEKEPDQTSLDIHQLGLLAKTAKEAIIRNHPEKLGLAMTQAQHYLQQLTVSNDTLDSCIKLALAEGALGAKLTGGGRGGCFLVLCDTKLKAEVIAKKLKAHGAKDIWLQGLGVYQHV
ncbi:MAG TPA: mevalonate kinase [Enterococcus sp.]|nr:mevalonate kinase [Enterococcus sp.]HPR80556.1 mevalonate kinase [Enterococcus sp.]